VNASPLSVPAERSHPLWWVLFLAATVGVIAISLAPAQSVQPAASIVPDYVGHAVGYAVLGVLAMQAARWPVRWTIVLIVLGTSLEVLQPVLSNRIASISDIIANTIGVLIGVGVGWLITRYRSRRQ
jgi:VanZ family protein